MAFPVPGWEPDTLVILVKVINLPALGKPFSGFVHCPHGQQNVGVGLSLIHILRSLLWAGKLCLNDISYHHFKGLPMFFIHGKQETGEHDDNHRHSRKVCPCAAFEQKKQRQSD